MKTLKTVPLLRLLHAEAVLPLLQAGVVLHRLQAGVVLPLALVSTPLVLGVPLLDIHLLVQVQEQMNKCIRTICNGYRKMEVLCRVSSRICKTQRPHVSPVNPEVANYVSLLPLLRHLS